MPPSSAGSTSTSRHAAARSAELICADVDAFEDRAVTLATNPAALAGLRERLATHRENRPLFQIETFCRALETGLLEISRAR